MLMVIIIKVGFACKNSSDLRLIAISVKEYTRCSGREQWMKKHNYQKQMKAKRKQKKARIILKTSS